MRVPAAAVLALGLALAAAGCTKSTPRAPQTFTVTIDKMAFGPIPADAHVGDKIHWVNNDIFQHSATAKDGSFDVDLAPKASADTTIARAGTTDFYCKYHPGMTGRLTVAS